MNEKRRHYERLVMNGIIPAGQFRAGQAYGPHGLWYEQDGRENYSKFNAPRAKEVLGNE